MAEEDFQIKITAQDAASATLDDVGGKAKEAGRDVDEAGDQAREAGESAKKSEQDFGGFGDALLDIEPTAAGATAAVVGLGAAAIESGRQIVQATLDVSDFATELDAAATQAGLSANTLQKWRVAGELAGVGAREVEDALKELRMRFGEARIEGQNSTQALDALGLTFADLNADLNNTDAVMRELLRRISRVDGEMRRQAIAAQTFGEQAGPKLLRAMEQGSEGITQLLADAERMAAKFDDETVEKSKELQAQTTALGQSWKELKTEALAPVIPIVDSVTQGITEATEKADEQPGIFNAVGNALRGTVSSYFDMGQAAQKAAEDQDEVNDESISQIGIIAELQRAHQKFAKGDVFSLVAENIIGATKRVEEMVEAQEESNDQMSEAEKRQARMRSAREEAAAIRLKALRTENRIEAIRLRRKAKIREIRAQDLTQSEEELRILKARREAEQKIAEIRRSNQEAILDGARSVVDAIAEGGQEALNTASAILGIGDAMEDNSETAEKSKTADAMRETKTEAQRAAAAMDDLSRDIETFSAQERTFRNVAGSIAGATSEALRFGERMRQVQADAEGVTKATAGAAAAASTLSAVGQQAAQAIGEGYRQQAGIRAAFETAAGIAAVAAAAGGAPNMAIAAAKHFTAAALFGAIAAGAGKNPNAQATGGAADVGGGGGGTEAQSPREATPSRTRARETTEPRGRRPIQMVVDMRNSTHVGQTGPEAQREIEEAASKGAAQTFS